MFLTISTVAAVAAVAPARVVKDLVNESIKVTTSSTNQRSHPR